jgi:putative tricarboxylic transport membrane protein
MEKREKERISALFWVVVAISICFGSVRLNLGGLHKPGPGFFPFLVGSILGILSFLLFLQSFKRLPGDEKRPFWPNPKRSLKITYILIALILYALGMDYLGFLFSTLLFLGFLLKAIEPQRWPMVLSGSILGTILFYGVFKYWLDIPFPTGILGF